MPFDRTGILPVWSDDGLEEERGEDASSVEYCEHNVDNVAIEVVGQHGTREVISLFLEDWEVGRVAISCRLSMDLLCQVVRDMCKGSSESLYSPRSLCSELVELSQQQCLFLTVDGL